MTQGIPDPKPRRARTAGEAAKNETTEPVERDVAGEESVRPSRAKEKPKRRLSAVQVLGALLAAFGLAMFGYAAWQYFGTNITANQAISVEKKNLKEEWAKAPSTTESAPIPGDAMALLRIPKLGDDYEYPIIAGTTSNELGRGIGWYTETAQPGQVGNFAVAGHRITHGEPFARMLDLRPGDKVIVETRSHIYTYELTSDPNDLTVKDDEGSWVLRPVPDEKKSDVAPTQALITLTTCSDLVASPDRSIAFGKLVQTTAK